jgi:hypothetical protein
MRKALRGFSHLVRRACLGGMRAGIEDVASIFQERSELKYPQRVQNL